MAGAFHAQVSMESLEQLPRGEVVNLLQQERGKVLQLKGSMEALVQASQQQVKLDPKLLGPAERTLAGPPKPGQCEVDRRDRAPNFRPCPGSACIGAP